MPIDTELLEILACPSEDHAPLRQEVDADGESLVCTVCLTRYPIRDDIPVLLTDDATPGPRGIGVPAGDPSAPAGGAAPSAEPGAGSGSEPAAGRGADSDGA